MANLILTIFTLTVTLVPALPALYVIQLSRQDEFWSVYSFLTIPLAYLIFYPILCGLLSQKHARGVVAGKFPMDLSLVPYRTRRLYGFCWVALYYCTPIYYFVLQIPFLKAFILRLFSYKGSTKVTLYPDSWIRDLPLLDLAEGVYLANKCTMGTNLVLTTREILVDKIHVGENSTIGHLAIVGLGTRIGKGCEIGIGVAVGLRCSIGDGCRFAPTCAINHGVSVGNGTQVGAMSYIGLRAQIGENLEIPAGANIPAGTILNTPEDVSKIFSSETALLLAEKDRLLQQFVETTPVETARMESVSNVVKQFTGTKAPQDTPPTPTIHKNG